jgi:hypothetical protein
LFDIFLGGQWLWLSNLGLTIRTAESLIFRHKLPLDFVERFKIGIMTLAFILMKILKVLYFNCFEDEEAAFRRADGQTINWTLDMDSQVMMWATQQPHDWQFGGNCECYVFGNGRHSQLGEGGK